jgi:hypothetical protein
MNFCPGSKNSIIGKIQRKPEDMTELSKAGGPCLIDIML